MEKRKIKCDVVVSMTDDGDKVGVYYVNEPDGLLFECEPQVARHIVTLWNDAVERTEKDNAI